MMKPQYEAALQKKVKYLIGKRKLFMMYRKNIKTVRSIIDISFSLKFLFN